MTAGRQAVEDYRSTQLSLRAHPASFLRDAVDAMNVVRCADLASLPGGRNVEDAMLRTIGQKDFVVAAGAGRRTTSGNGPTDVTP